MSENELEIIPSIVPSCEIVSLESSVNAAEKYVELMGRIRLMAIKLLNSIDVSNHGGKPYIEKSGCDKIASAFGVSIFDIEYEREVFNDDKGEYYVYSCSGRGKWNNHNETEIGVASSRDDFFGTRKENGIKAYKPLSEVDPCDIKKKAFTNFANRIIKKLIGLSFTWEELSSLSGGKISQSSCQTVEFGKGSKGGNTDSPETKKLRDECRTMLLKLCDNDTESAKTMLVEETSFVGQNGPVAGKNNVSLLSEKQIQILHGKLKKKVSDFEKQLDEEAAKQ